MKKSNRCTGIVWRVKSAHPPWCAQAVNMHSDDDYTTGGHKTADAALRAGKTAIRKLGWQVEGKWKVVKNGNGNGNGGPA